VTRTVHIDTQRNIYFLQEKAAEAIRNGKGTTTKTGTCTRYRYARLTRIGAFGFSMVYRYGYGVRNYLFINGVRVPVLVRVVYIRIDIFLGGRPRPAPRPGPGYGTTGIDIHLPKYVPTKGFIFYIYPRASFAKDVSLLTIWPKDTHRQGLGVD
jgi:hypothetical protein